jgi:soluble lytic murein transglycosylase-like protein
LEHFMRIWVLLAALIAFAQPAFAAHSHRHSHRSHHVHHAGHHHHFARAHRVWRAPVESGYAMPQVFARTDSIDTPFFSDPPFPNRAWTQNVYRYSGDQAWPPASAQQFSTFAPTPRAAARDHGALDAMIARHAAANGLPVALVHRVVIRESRYNPGARNGPNLGLMQIQYRTARGVGYTGSAAGLLDAETNLTYAVRYLAGAYRAAGGNASRAVAYYASGYHGRGVRQPAATQLALARAPAPRQVASAQPSWEMQSSPVLLRGDAMYEPRLRRQSRQL